MGNTQQQSPWQQPAVSINQQLAFYAQYLSDSDDNDMSEIDKAPQSILVYARTETNSFFQHVIDAKITRKQKDLIFGYVHQTELEYDGMKIPIDITYLFAAFYCVFRDGWNRKYSGSDLLFIGHRIIKKLKGEQWSISAFGYEVNNKICDVLRIEFKWKCSAYRNGIYFGYIPAALLDEVKWDNSTLLSHWVTVNFIDQARFHAADDAMDGEMGIVGTSNAFQVTCYTLVFDFVESKVYLGRNKTDAVELQCNAIIPAVGVFDQGDLIEVSKYELTKYSYDPASQRSCV